VGDKAALFHGPAGVGKTCLIEALGKEKDLEIIELNASDYRTAKQIREIIGKSMAQKAILKRGKIFLVDEIDGLCGRKDRGGASEVIKMIRESRFPIILTANDPWSPKLRSLRKYSVLIKFGKVPHWDVVKRLKHISQNEGVEIDEPALKQLAKMSEGDLRSAINDLETLIRVKKKITTDDLESLGQRQKQTNIFDALMIIFKTKTALAAKLALNNTDKSPDDVFWWIEQNIANEYEKPEEIAKAFDALSRADLFRGRIRRRQNWKLLKYMIDMMTGGVALSKKEMYRKFSRYSFPDKIKYLGGTKFARREEKERLLELSKQLHCSTKKIRREFLPYLDIMRTN